MSERLCFVINLRPGGAALYDQLHQGMSARTRETLLACGFSDYTIFRHEDLVIGYARCDPDVDTVLARQDETLGDELSPLAEVIAGPLVRASQVWRLDGDTAEDTTAVIRNGEQARRKPSPREEEQWPTV